MVIRMVCTMLAGRSLVAKKAIGSSKKWAMNIISQTFIQIRPKASGFVNKVYVATMWNANNTMLLINQKGREGISNRSLER
jgi:hypothetical protein